MHGANDIAIINKINTDNKKLNSSKMIFNYVLTVIISAVLFFYIPLFTLILFITASGYHFGEQHWSSIISNETSKIKSAFQLTYGLFILLLLFYFNSTEVIIIVESITSHKLNSNVIEYAFYVLLVLLALNWIYLYANDKIFKSNAIAELLYLIVLSILFKVSSLIWGFAIYFIVWHSVPSLVDQIKFLYGGFTMKKLLRYIKTALLNWIISLVSLAIFYSLFHSTKLFEALLFSFLAAVTFPHTIVILNMFKIKKAE
jgi:Brp/Blh family beta-carotene 15,15'-monooxygenase